MQTQPNNQTALPFPTAPRIVPVPPPHKASYNLQEVAVKLSCHVMTVRRLIDEGELKAVRRWIGKRGLRVIHEDLQTYLQSHEHDPYA